ncbi:toll/interleukin-1 receptor domain-containing protein [Panacibacter ginsenosidivorans]|uniref:Toll/interleukin-1 receptor domain-containing protein n=1 Tax=Panacibacter ginsenosidivorans TaxID=1813871 RepID=A0A5B8VAD4_9BACT|nr:toll/interleukin-1 receptor domain-containing protein [Panacibacter ginsenosidivorans]QEC68229.1 toll/interleukin-1 receptor domain-containing protein [Panacibacter ginsenosidivorans]
MEDEKIIRQEGLDFYKSKIEPSQKYHAVDDFHELKMRLDDFYAPESKAIFLDEIANKIAEDLQKHRDKSHGGQPGINCEKERKPPKLLFYIKQELGTLPLVAHQRSLSNPQQTRNKVFISYSHFDKDILVDVQRHFKPFINQIEIWDDSKILPGQKWKEEVRKAIDQTKVAILLISTDFLGSEFIANNELPPLLQAAEENGAVILIVILKPCLFEEFDKLNQFQTLNPPNNPVIKMDNTEREETFVNLVRQTKKILSAE